MLCCVLFPEWYASEVLPTPMIENTPPVIHLTPETDDEAGGSVVAAETTPERAATLWVSRLTKVVGGTCLLFALTLWLLRPEHYRTVLALLTVAMFAAIFHTYPFADGSV